MRTAVLVGPVAVVLLLVLGSVPVGASSPRTGPSPAPTSESATPSFAVRAGYVPDELHRVEAIRPADGNRTVDVVFAPPAPSGRPAGVGPAGSWGGFEARYGLGPRALAQAQAYFQGYGLQAAPISSDGLSLELSGSVADLGRAFHTRLAAADQGGSPVTFPLTPPSLPFELEHEIAGVVGLASGFDTFSAPLRSEATVSPGLPLSSPYLSMPGRIRDSYGLSELYNLSGGPPNASGQAIAVVLWGEGYAPSDLATFFSQYYPSSFPKPTVVPVPVNGAPNASDLALGSPDLAAVEELTLDIEWSASMAPGATIYAVYTHDGPPPNYGPSAANLTTALERALSLRSSTNLTAISMSFGSPEASDAALISAWNPIFAEARSLGVSILAATGDTGGDTTACSGTPAPEFPASSPDVIAVGGTNVTFTGPGATQFTESAWSKGGGGFSQVYAAPSWQEVGSAAGPIGANGHRGFPDVSGSAADDFLYFDGSTSAAAGTSFATPMWAGLVTDLGAKWGHPLGFFTDRLYHVAANASTGAIGEGLVDVVGGGNCVGPADPGWDVATGWGSPRAAVLYVDLLGSFVNLTLDVRPSPVAPGGTLQLKVVLTNRTSGAPIAGVPVVMSVRSDLPAGPCTGTFGSTSPLTDANGSASAGISLPLCYVGTHAIVTVRVATVHYYGSNSTRVGVNLLGWFPQLGFLDHGPWRYAAFAGIVGGAVVLGWALGRLIDPLAAPGRIPPPEPTAPASTGSAPDPAAAAGPGPEAGGPGGPPAGPPTRAEDEPGTTGPTARPEASSEDPTADSVPAQEGQNP